MKGLTSLGNARAQAFVISPGLSQLTTGTFTKVRAIWCHSEGAIDITFSDGTEETHTYTDGDQFVFESRAEIDVTSGTWSFMVA